MALGDLVKIQTYTDTWAYSGICISNNYLYVGNVVHLSTRNIKRTDLALSQSLVDVPNTYLQLYIYRQYIDCEKDDSYLYIGYNYASSGGITAVYKYNIASQTNTRIIPSGVEINEIGTCGGIFRYGSSYLFVCDTAKHRILVTDTNGDYITSFGALGNGSSEFNTPRDITIINDYIYVADFENSRIAIWRIIDFDPLTIETTNVIISTSGYGDGKPNGICSYSNQIYVTTNTTLLVYVIGDDGISYELKLNKDVTSIVGSGYYIRPSSVECNSNNIYIFTFNNSTYTKGVMLDNAIENTVLAEFSMDLSEGSFIKSSYDFSLSESSFIKPLFSFDIESSGWWQFNRVLANITGFSLEGRLTKNNIISQFDFSLVSGSDGFVVYMDEPFSINITIDSIYGLIDNKFSLIGALVGVQSCQFESSFDFSLIALPANNLVSELKLLDGIDVDGYIFDSIGAEGNLVMDIDITADGNEGTHIHITDFLDLLVYSIVAGQIGCKGELHILDININSDIYQAIGLEGHILLDALNISGYGGTITEIIGDIKPVELIVDSYLNLSGISAELSVLDTTVSGSIILIPTIDGSLSLMNVLVISDAKFPKQPIEEIEEPDMELKFLSKLCVLNRHTLAVTEYKFDIDITDIEASDDVIYVTDGKNLYTLNGNGNIYSEVEIGNLDIDIPVVRNKMYIYLSGRVADGKLVITTENGSYSYPITMIRTEGERRVVLGKGLLGRLKSIKIESNNPYEIDRIRIEANLTGKIR